MKSTHDRAGVHWRLKVIKETRPPADVLGLSHCNDCGLCCTISPCKLRGIRDLKRLAKLLGQSPKHVGRKHIAIMPGPRRFEVRVRRLDEGDPLSPCVFLGADFRCQVHQAKPAGGRDFECWTLATHELQYGWDRSELDKLKKITR